MKNLIMAALVATMTGCTAYYPQPEAGFYDIKVMILPSTEDVRTVCDIGQNVRACAWMNSNPCHIAMSVDDWEKWTVHEVGHCLRVNVHNPRIGG